MTIADTPSADARSAHAMLPLAALVHPDDQLDMEALLEATARSLQQRGWRVGGLVHRMDQYPNGNKRMQLLDLRSAQQFELTQDLGAASQACSLNPQALAQASRVLRQCLADAVDLVVINRFGQVEAAGRGFANEFAAFVDAGIPVLTAVAARHTVDWQRFTGGMHASLPADAAQLLEWCLQQLPQAPATPGAPGAAAAVAEAGEAFPSAALGAAAIPAQYSVPTARPAAALQEHAP
ncbi:DUF2478 domain-containing protein [Comamonas sp. 17RB]|uniref:DUF2478 domain-containing protein n=1 Tax=Comamonas sp. 17RB TaxID=3047025 RepID=UPI0024B7C785|nr:DUF2478 domain-containing protein [Comamonas sp. 17RB]MDI9855566.1 DUF2478 domain-containing protein [Comamonas sp. 17RB]